MLLERACELMGRKLAGEASEAELEELDQLLKANPGLHFPMQNLSDLWQRKAVADQDELEQAFRKHLRRMEEQGISFAANSTEAEEPATFRIPDRTRRNKPWKYVAAAASLLLAGSLIWYYSHPAIAEKQPGLSHEKQAPSSEIVTRNGSRTRVTLPDGSIVWLNAGSKLNYDKSFGQKLREVTLTGEAFFDVVKNPDQPFIIHTKRINIKVLGTQFNVKSYPGEKTTEAALVKGSIEVDLHSEQSGKFILKPNQKIIVGEESATEAPARAGVAKSQEPVVSVRQMTIDEKDGTALETAWVENKLAFVEEPFADVALKMERWYGVTISFSNPKLSQVPLTGSFSNESIKEALHALSIATPFTYRFADAKSIVIGK